MGLVTMGFATMSMLGLLAQVFKWSVTVLMTAMFFACVGMIYDRAIP